MATNVPNLYAETTRQDDPPVQPDRDPGAVKVKKFATGTGTLPVGTPLKISSGQMAPLASLASASTEVIVGFTREEVTLNASNEVLAPVLFRGALRYADIAAAQATVKGSALNGTETSNLETILRKSNLREDGLDIQGLDDLG